MSWKGNLLNPNLNWKLYFHIGEVKVGIETYLVRVRMLGNHKNSKHEKKLLDT
jgi:hypothetical protein